jgi:hypothetical protein
MGHFCTGCRAIKILIFMKHIFTVCLLLMALQVEASGSDADRIKKHLQFITKAGGYRHHDNLVALDLVADYITGEFARYTSRVTTQPYEVDGKTYKNVIASFGPQHAKRIVIGAHYDVCGEQEGADDNASGVVGLLELARLLHDEALNYRVDLVAFTLEEPPHFRTDLMGSYVHAKSLKDEKAKVAGMISLEMIGYFDDARHSQEYPVRLLKTIYGTRGNYITVVKKMGGGRFARQFSGDFKKTQAIRTKKFAGPAWVPGLDFSDHMNYWRFGYSALMLTDTAFYRNKNYHKYSDTIETLDLPRMAKVIDGVHLALQRINKKGKV